MGFLRICLFSCFLFFSSLVLANNNHEREEFVKNYRNLFSSISGIAYKGFIEKANGINYKNISYMPDHMRVENLLLKKDADIFVINEWLKLFSEKEYRDFNDFFEIKEGKEYITIMSEFINRKNRSEPIDGYLEKVEKISKELEQYEHIISKLRNKMDIFLSYYPIENMFYFMGERITDYYKDNQFTKKDSGLCVNSNKVDLIVYAIYVCDAGMRAKNYASIMEVAKQYYSGIYQPFRNKDIEEAKVIYRNVIKDDFSGEAHFLLGMLIKNAPSSDDKSQDSLCLIKTASKLGYKVPPSVMDMFSQEEHAYIYKNKF